jgi:hypothetical protein
MGDNNGDWAFLFLGDGFALDAWFQGSIEVAVNKYFNFGSRDFLLLIIGEFLILLDVLNCECGPFFLTTMISSRDHVKMGKLTD